MSLHPSGCNVLTKSDQGSEPRSWLTIGQTPWGCTCTSPSIRGLSRSFRPRCGARSYVPTTTATTRRAVFYGGIDRHPALIIRVADATDVSRAIALARESGLELAVRSGGHSVAGHSTTNGGIILDLSEMKGLEIDLERHTVFAHRGRQIMAAVGAVYERPDEAPMHEEWVSAFAAALSQGDPGVYVNFLGDEGEGRVREAYPGSTWERLAEIKGRYDPTNLFRLYQNIRPTAQD